MICRPARMSRAMKGVVFQTSAMTIANRDAHWSPVQRMWVRNKLLAMPWNAKMKSHSLAVTAVGMAQGTRTLARSSPRPLNARFMITAIHIPRQTSMTTVATVKKMVTPMEDQNSAPSEPGGHRVEAGVVLEGHDDAPHDRVEDHDRQEGEGRRDQVESEQVPAGGAPGDP